MRFLWSGEGANLRVSGLGDYYAEFSDRGEVVHIETGVRSSASLEMSMDKRTVDMLNSGKFDLDYAVRNDLIEFQDKNLVVAVKLQIALSFVHMGEVWDGVFGPGVDNLASSVQ